MKRLKKTAGPKRLGTNMHVMQGHQRLDFVMQEHVPGGNVLDIGSGEGGFALALHRAGCKVTMLDILPVIPPDPAIYAVLMDLYQLRQTDAYDTILLMEVIEHLEDPALAVRIAYDALRDKGKLLITTPWVDTWDNEADHLWRFTFRGLAKLLQTYATKLWQDDTFIYAVVEKCVPKPRYS